MRNARLEETQAGIKIAGRNINNLRYADDTTIMAESEEELKSLLMKFKEESENVGLKLNIHITKIMASGPITSWEIDGETVSDFIFSGSKTTVNGDYSHEIKRHLLLGRKVMTKLDSILNLPTMVCLVKAMVFPVVMYGCENWTIKKAEHRKLEQKQFKNWTHVYLWRIHFDIWQNQYNIVKFKNKIKKNCFWTVVLEKTLESPLGCKEIQLVHPKGNQSWIFIGRTDA